MQNAKRLKKTANLDVVKKRNNEDGLLVSVNRPEVTSWERFHDTGGSFSLPYPHTVQAPGECKLTEQILNHHSKTQAWREAISKLRGRDPNKSTIRIPMPFKDDRFVYGIKHKPTRRWYKMVGYTSRCLRNSKDSYSPSKGALSTGSVSSILITPPVVIGGPDDDKDDDKDDEDHT